MGKRKHIPSGRFHRLSQNTGVFFQLHLGVPNHGSRQAFFQRHTDAIGKVVRLVHHDDDVLQGKIHGFETGLTHAVIEQVIVIADEDVCVADGFARCFPRTGLCRLSVNGVGSADVHEFVNVQGRGEDAFLQSRCGCDPRFAGTGFSWLDCTTERTPAGTLWQRVGRTCLLGPPCPPTGRASNPFVVR